MATDSGPTPIPLRDVLAEGTTITAILAVWGVLAVLGRYGIGNIGLAGPGHFFFEVGNVLAAVFVVVGLANVLVYAIARGIQFARY